MFPSFLDERSFQRQQKTDSKRVLYISPHLEIPKAGSREEAICIEVSALTNERKKTHNNNNNPNNNFSRTNESNRTGIESRVNEGGCKDWRQRGGGRG
jgi:hypothetical protein